MSHQELTQSILDINWNKVTASNHWLYSNPFISHFVNTFSIGVPAAEACCIKSLQSIEEEIKSPQLKEYFNQFIKEECSHSLVHKKFNRYLEKFGYPIQSYEKLYHFFFKIFNKNYSSKTKAAIATSIEHYSTSIAIVTIDLNVLEYGNCEICNFMYWHALEEVEHKDYLFDVYKDIGGGYFRRVIVYTFFLFLLFGIAGGIIYFKLLFADLRKNKIKRKHFTEAFLFMFKRPGVFWAFSKKLLSFYKINFRP